MPSLSDTLTHWLREIHALYHGEVTSPRAPARRAYLFGEYARLDTRPQASIIYPLGKSLRHGADHRVSVLVQDGHQIIVRDDVAAAIAITLLEDAERGVQYAFPRDALVKAGLAIRQEDMPAASNGESAWDGLKQIAPDAWTTYFRLFNEPPADGLPLIGRRHLFWSAVGPMGLDAGTLSLLAAGITTSARRNVIAAWTSLNAFWLLSPSPVNGRWTATSDGVLRRLAGQLNDASPAIACAMLEAVLGYWERLAWQGSTIPAPAERDASKKLRGIAFAPALPDFCSPAFLVAVREHLRALNRQNDMQAWQYWQDSMAVIIAQCFSVRGAGTVITQIAAVSLAYRLHILARAILPCHDTDVDNHVTAPQSNCPPLPAEQTRQYAWTILTGKHPRLGTVGNPRIAARRLGVRRAWARYYQSDYTLHILFACAEAAVVLHRNALSALAAGAIPTASEHAAHAIRQAARGIGIWLRGLRWPTYARRLFTSAWGALRRLGCVLWRAFEKLAALHVAPCREDGQHGTAEGKDKPRAGADARAGKQNTQLQRHAPLVERAEREAAMLAFAEVTKRLACLKTPVGTAPPLGTGDTLPIPSHAQQEDDRDPHETLLSAPSLGGVPCGLASSPPHVICRLTACYRRLYEIAETMTGVSPLPLETFASLLGDVLDVGDYDAMLAAVEYCRQASVNSAPVQDARRNRRPVSAVW